MVEYCCFAFLTDFLCILWTRGKLRALGVQGRFWHKGGAACTKLKEGCYTSQRNLKGLLQHSSRQSQIFAAALLRVALKRDKGPNCWQFKRRSSSISWRQQRVNCMVDCLAFWLVGQKSKADNRIWLLLTTTPLLQPQQQKFCFLKYIYFHMTLI